MALKPSIAESLTDQLIKLEGMYDRGTITKQEFEKAKSILFEPGQNSTVKKKKRIIKKTKKRKREINKKTRI